MASNASAEPPAGASRSRPRVSIGRTRAARARGPRGSRGAPGAALRVFARRGYREAGVDEIAAEAGYSKGALYWHFSGKEELLIALLEERIDAPMRDRFALLASAPPERDMSVEASREFARQLSEQREACCWSASTGASRSAIPSSAPATASGKRSSATPSPPEWRRARATSGRPELTMPAEDVARIVMSIIGGLGFDELIEPGTVRPELLGEALAVIYAGLVARAQARARSKP